ncbi:MAG TPA: hypothetical protein VF796_16545, partial [Humisphaera sp.]
MIVLSHRGYWKAPAERNTEAAFRRSFALGFGTETDVRDAAGTLVISHDPPAGGEMTLDALLALRAEYAGPGRPLPLALNVKSDGLYPQLKAALDRHAVPPGAHFVFDMSVPDALGYLRHGVRAFTRQSEYEPDPAFYDRAAGVWVDCFHGDWVDAATIARHLDAGKQVCLVSPDLHKRPAADEWARLAAMPVAARAGVMICTDDPEGAAAAFAAAGPGNAPAGPPAPVIRSYKLADMTRGWFVGDFAPTLLRTGLFEVACQHYRAGDHEARHTHRVATEITLIAVGRARMDGVEYAAGDIVVIPPGGATDFRAVEDTTTVVVKVPSVRGDKYPA